MLKALIWIVSNDDRFFSRAINILGQQHNGLELVGVTAGMAIQLDCDGEDVPFVPLDEVAVGGVYDVLLVVGAKEIGMSKITQAARQLNLPEEKLLGDWIVCILGFTLKNYRRLQRSRLSIFAMNCFGGLISHLFGLPLHSPFFNMYLSERDFLSFLREPHVYLEEPLTLKNMMWSESLRYDYPIAKLGNIDLMMNHYRDFDTAKFNWDKRKERINWYNLFVTMYTEREEILQAFDALPYSKKVCFVPFKSDLDSAWYINPEIDFDRKEAGFYDVVNNFARGKHFYYDPFDMLLYGKKTPLIEM